MSNRTMVYAFTSPQALHIINMKVISTTIAARNEYYSSEEASHHRVFLLLTRYLL